MNINFTDIGLQLIIFIAAFFIMNAYIFQPLLKIRALRNKETMEKEKLAAEKKQRAENMAGEYNKAILQARQKATQEIQQTVGAASEKASSMVASARDEGQQIFSDKKEAVAEQQVEIQNQLKNDVEALADELVQAAS